MMVIEGKEAIVRVDWQRVRTIIAEAGLNERDVQQLEQAFRQSTFCWFGRILTAVRDAENRLMFCGYDPRGFKLLVWTLSAVLCGLAGALYVPQVGIINPSEMSPTNSIEAAIWVALGGRGTLIGPVLGAGLVNGAKSIFTVAMPEYWQLFLGLIFIIVTLFLPRGVMGLLRRGDR